MWLPRLAQLARMDLIAWMPRMQLHPCSAFPHPLLGHEGADMHLVAHTGPASTSGSSHGKCMVPRTLLPACYCAVMGTWLPGREHCRRGPADMSPAITATRPAPCDDPGTLCLQGLRALYPGPGIAGAVELLPADLARLDPEEFLNDTIIDFWMKCACRPPRCPCSAVLAQLSMPCNIWPHTLRPLRRRLGQP